MRLETHVCDGTNGVVIVHDKVKERLVPAVPNFLRLKVCSPLAAAIIPCVALPLEIVATRGGLGNHDWLAFLPGKAEQISEARFVGFKGT